MASSYSRTSGKEEEWDLRNQKDFTEKNIMILNRKTKKKIEIKTQGKKTTLKKPKY